MSVNKRRFISLLQAPMVNVSSAQSEFVMTFNIISPINTKDNNHFFRIRPQIVNHLFRARRALTPCWSIWVNALMAPNRQLDTCGWIVVHHILRVESKRSVNSYTLHKTSTLLALNIIKLSGNYPTLKVLKTSFLFLGNQNVFLRHCCVKFVKTPQFLWSIANFSSIHLVYTSLVCLHFIFSQSV